MARQPVTFIELFLSSHVALISAFKLRLISSDPAMGAYYDEIEIEDMIWDDEKQVFHYPCPCGDRFEISHHQLANYEDVATCPSCSLVIRVIYDPVRFPVRSTAIVMIDLC